MSKGNDYFPEDIHSTDECEELLEYAKNLQLFQVKESPRTGENDQAQKKIRRDDEQLNDDK
uniref:Uncharacterized protein n=1 Tax=Glossina palpalis gambiensis TaxID=67801 RepID=A0A1B0BL35_9MUSC